MGSTSWAIMTSWAFLDSTSLLGLLGLRPVLVHQTEQRGGCLTVQRLVELVDGRRNLQTLVQDGPLTLQTHILGPLDEPGKVGLRLDILADAKVLGPLLKQRVDDLL